MAKLPNQPKPAPPSVYNAGGAQTVVRYVPTYVNKDGMRTLISAAQGGNTFPSAKAAQRYLRQVLKNNSADVLRRSFGDDPRFEVRPVECWAGHFDPCRIYFD